MWILVIRRSIEYAFPLWAFYLFTWSEMSWRGSKHFQDYSFPVDIFRLLISVLMSSTPPVDYKHFSSTYFPTFYDVFVSWALDFWHPGRITFHTYTQCFESFPIAYSLISLLRTMINLIYLMHLVINSHSMCGRIPNTAMSFSLKWV